MPISAQNKLHVIELTKLSKGCVFVYDCVYNTRLKTSCWSGRAAFILFEEYDCLLR